MSFPRISMSGTLILAVYVTSIKYLFDNSLYGTALRSTGNISLESSSSILFNSFIMSTSFLNVVSHSAVVLGALNDTYVLSILVGVGFDVITRILQLIWWIQITTTTIIISFRRQQEEDINNNTNNNINTNANYYNIILLCSVLTIIYIYHMIIHVRVLRMNYSYERLSSVLTGALNNLRGIPGDKFQDHLFAYSDLGSHLLPFFLSIILLQKQKALFTSFIVLALLILISSFALSRIPLNNNNNNEVNNDSCDEDDEKSMNKFINVSNDGSITCSCSACRKRSKRTNSQESSSFTFNIADGICHLWLCSFENLSTFLSSYKYSSSSVIHSKKIR